MQSENRMIGYTSDQVRQCTMWISVWSKAKYRLTSRADHQQQTLAKDAGVARFSKIQQKATVRERIAYRRRTEISDRHGEYLYSTISCGYRMNRSQADMRERISAEALSSARHTAIRRALNWKFQTSGRSPSSDVCLVPHGTEENDEYRVT